MHFLLRICFSPRMCSVKYFFFSLITIFSETIHHVLSYHVYVYMYIYICVYMYTYFYLNLCTAAFWVRALICTQLFKFTVRNVIIATELREPISRKKGETKCKRDPLGRPIRAACGSLVRSLVSPVCTNLTRLSIKKYHRRSPDYSL